MNTPEPFAVLLDRLSHGDLQAAQQLMVTYEPYLRAVARRRLSPALRPKLDSIDVVQSVWVHVLRHVGAHGWHIRTAAHLRAFLVQVTCQRLTDRFRHYRVALEKEHPLASLGAGDQPLSPRPRPSELAQVGELWQRMLALSPPAHHQLLLLRREGFSLEEIAAQTGLHEDSIRRILRDLRRRLAFEPRPPATATPLSP
jgi:RNA polymerase sigma-70 factor (ECF subfamily)